ncbi:MAG: hypothetical protein EXR73_13190, partial [Myxococcales bacterium]|nr:hypothetical protein [Myxococcales bacterium]
MIALPELCEQRESGFARFGDHHRSTLAWQLHEASVAVQVIDEDREQRYGFELRVDAGAELVAGDDETSQWSMVRGLSLRRSRDAFAEVTRQMHGALFPMERPRRAERVRRPAAEVEAARATMRRVYGRVRELAIAAADRCVPAPREIALRFLPHLRFRVYQYLVRDPTGRLAQLAATAPGALIFALALVERGGRCARAGERMLGDVVAGRRLRQLLDEAITSWADAASDRIVRAEGESSRFNGVWQRLLDLSPPRRASALAAQRLLVLRAGPQVPTTLLFLPPPVWFAPEDIPTAVRANARWYRVMKGSWVTLRDGDARDPARPAIVRFASRHAAALAGGSDRSIRDTLGQLADYAVATGRRPGRCTDPTAVVEESGRWHARLARAGELAELERIAGLDAGTLTSGGDLALPPAPLAAWTRGSATVRPLVTA